VAISIASFHKREACPFLRACHHCYFICSKEIVWKFYGEFLIDFYASKKWQIFPAESPPDFIPVPFFFPLPDNRDQDAGEPSGIGSTRQNGGLLCQYM
jgi:hypothetical protein